MKKFILIALTLTNLTACQSTVTPTKSSSEAIKKPSQHMMCTMQYAPVCGKIDNNGVISYKTFSNSCVASNSNDNVVSYADGACQAN